MHRPRRVVLVRAGKAEIGENAVAHEFGDEAVVACDHAGARVLIGPDDLAHVLGIESRRKRGGSDEIAEHDGQLAPLGGVRGRRRLGRRGGSGGRGKLRGGRQNLAPMPDAGDADLLQIVRSDVGKDCRVDLVLGERLFILPEPQAAQPSPDVHSHSPEGASR
jgi:hypothetical protein